MKPGSCGPAAVGIQLVIYDENGDEIPAGSGKAGYICVRNPWPGRMVTVWGQDQRFIDTYYARFCKDAAARTGATGRSCAATARSRPQTGTFGSWAGSTT
jgi:acetyl-CoA synthetase